MQRTNKGPCASSPENNYLYRNSFVYDESLTQGELGRLCIIRKEMYGEPSKPCRENADLGNCWDKRELKNYYELLETHGFAPNTLEFHKFFSLTNVVMGRYIRPSEFMKYLEISDQTANAHVFKQTCYLIPYDETNSAKGLPNNDPRIKALIFGETDSYGKPTYPLNQITLMTGCFYIWIKSIKTNNGIIKYRVLAYAVDRDPKGTDAKYNLNAAFNAIKTTLHLNLSNPMLGKLKIQGLNPVTRKISMATVLKDLNHEPFFKPNKVPQTNANIKTIQPTNTQGKISSAAFQPTSGGLKMKMKPKTL